MKYDLDDYAHDWNSATIRSASFTCGYCGERVNSEKGMSLGYHDKYGTYKTSQPAGIYICTSCNLPTFIGKDKKGMEIQVPGQNFGNSVQNVEPDVNEIYEEARSAYSVGAYTGVILLCRTLLDHVAVSFGAKENQSFQFYVDYLADHNYVTTNSTKWIDAIRKYGNAATHRLVINTRQQAELIIKFCEMLLKSNFEYPALLDAMDVQKNE